MSRISAAGSHAVPTNANQGSTLILQVTPITFEQLWDNYVTGHPYDDPDDTYPNQCAIRLSATLHAVGIDMKSFSQKTVSPSAGKPSLGRILLKGKATATRAEEMARWLKLKPFVGLPSKPEDITGVDWEEKVAGRTGIIFFHDYWTSDDNSSGGHIDLWNGSRFPHNGVRGGLHNFCRFTLGVHHPWFNMYGDLRNAKLILFWEIT